MGSGAMGSSMEWSCGELPMWSRAYWKLHLWSGAMWSSICEVGLLGAPSMEWNYGEFCGVELWGAPSVKWMGSYGEHHL